MSRTQGQPRGGKALLLFMSLAIALVACELMLRTWTPFPIHGALANRISDDVLRYRMDPRLDDIDPNGFRNDQALTRADIVTLGDSHTYGNNVRSSDSWPQQVARLTGATVYNLGVGGYGPLQYHYLLTSALDVAGSHLIVGLYLANDLYDTCALIREYAFWDEWARPRGYEVEACVGADAPETDLAPSLTASSAVGSLLAVVVERVREWQLSRGEVRMTDEIQPVRAVVVHDGKNDTLITHSRLATQARFTDLEQRDVAEAFHIVQDILRDVGRSAKERGIRPSVLIVPSKVRAMLDYLLARGHRLPDDYRRAAANEERLVRHLQRFCESVGLTCVDAKSYVARRLEEVGRVYPPTADGHPTAVGYEAYARAVVDGVLSPGPSSRTHAGVQ